MMNNNKLHPLDLGVDRWASLTKPIVSLPNSINSSTRAQQFFPQTIKKKKYKIESEMLSVK
jgi:hypothetical protein